MRKTLLTLALFSALFAPLSARGSVSPDAYKESVRDICNDPFFKDFLRTPTPASEYFNLDYVPKDLFVPEARYKVFEYLNHPGRFKKVEKGDGAEKEPFIKFGF